MFTDTRSLFEAAARDGNTDTQLDIYNGEGRFIYLCDDMKFKLYP